MKARELASVILVNLGMRFDRDHEFYFADACFRAANRVLTPQPQLITTQFILANFCRPMRLIEKKREKVQIEQTIRSMKPGECRVLTAALFQDLTLVKKQIRILESAQ